ncbi:MATE family efflux transporter [Sporobacter termitidis]|nr:MATE family efflux transporter [Sporobacter termitidis]
MPNSRNREINMCAGPLAPKILMFSLPLMAAGVLQLMFQAVNMVVVGRFRGSDALAAVGATFTLTELLLFVFMGLATGANVLVARYYGAKDNEGIEITVHTAVAASLVGGVFIGICGILLTEPLLRLTGTPESIIGLSAVYMKIYFAGLPIIALYNFGSAILRAVGDTKSPLYFLSLAGVLNVGLNLFFVLCLGMSVAGVAIASVMAQGLAAALVLRTLMKSRGAYAVRLRKLRIDWRKLWMIAKIGVPEGLQGMMFGISNVLIQSSINSFDIDVGAGNTAAINIEGFLYAALNALPQAAIAFTGQNMGAQKYDNVRRIYFSCCGFVLLVSAVLCTLTVVFRTPLISIYDATEPVVLQTGALRLLIICSTYAVLSLNNTTCGVMRGMGASLLPAIVCFMGICVFRVVWVETVFRIYRSYMTLMLSYPISWGITLAVNVLCLYIVKKRIIGRMEPGAARLQAS